MADRPAAPVRPPARGVTPERLRTLMLERFPGYRKTPLIEPTYVDFPDDVAANPARAADVHFQLSATNRLDELPPETSS